MVKQPTNQTKTICCDWTKLMMVFVKLCRIDAGCCTHRLFQPLRQWEGFCWGIWKYIFCKIWKPATPIPWYTRSLENLLRLKVKILREISFLDSSWEVEFFSGLVESLSGFLRSISWPLPQGLGAGWQSSLHSTQSSAPSVSQPQVWTFPLSFAFSFSVCSPNVRSFDLLDKRDLLTFKVGFFVMNIPCTNTTGLLERSWWDG